MSHTNAEVAWLCRLRWIASSFFLASGLLAFPSVFLVPQWQIPYLLCVFFVIAFNLRCTLRQRTLLPSEAPDEIFLELVVDLAVAGALLVFTGGTRNPVFSLLFIHSVLGALLLSGRRLAIFFLLLLCVVVAAFLARNEQVITGSFYANEVVPPAAVAFSLCVVGALVAWLAQVRRQVRKSDERQRQRDARMESLLASGALAADFSHRFATPLNNLGLRLARARSRTAPHSEALAELDAAESSVRQCESLLREVVSTSLDASMSQFGTLDVGTLLRQVVERWNQTQPGALATVDDDSKEPLKVRAPAILLSKTFTNLLENSAHHQDRHGNIRIRLDRDTEFASISFHDEGPGWPEAILNRGIRPFATTRPGGTGLGLHNALSLCEALGGEFRIANGPKGGAIATLYLPLVPDTLGGAQA